MFSGLSVVQLPARRWTALASFTLQSTIIAAVLAFPMLYPQNLPSAFLARRIFAPMSDAEVTAADSKPGTGSSQAPRPSIVVAPDHGIIFGTSQTVTDDSIPVAPDLGPVVGPGSHVDWSIGSGPTTLPAPPAPVRPIRVSEVMLGNLIHRVDPQYPAIARQIRLQGTVVLNAIISREGNIEKVDVATGSFLLAGAARDAVRQWKYRPYILNGEPVEVETQITINFTMGN